MMASVGSTLGFQPEIVPSSVAKRNWLGPEALPCLTTKSSVLLKTLPVGAPPGFPFGRGMVTAGPTRMPLPSYCVPKPVPLSDTSQGPDGLCDKPQALTRFGSWNSAILGRSDTRFVWTYSPLLGAPATTGSKMSSDSATVAATATVLTRGRANTLTRMDVPPFGHASCLAPSLYGAPGTAD